jgi:hypothetical protein
MGLPIALEPPAPFAPELLPVLPALAFGSSPT